MKLLDAIINCIIVPLGYSDAFQVLNPFQQTDVLNMRGKFHIGMTLMELIIHWSSAPFDISYKAFYLMFSKNLIKLNRRNNMKDESINILEYEINQTVSLHEGLLPIGNQDFVNHQMCDLTFGIRLFGTASGFNSFAGERGGGIFKRLLKKGGVATEIGIMDKYDRLENHLIDIVYSKKLEDIFKYDEKYQQLQSQLNQYKSIDNLNTDRLYYTEHRISLYGRTDHTIHNNEEVFEF